MKSSVKTFLVATMAFSTFTVGLACAETIPVTAGSSSTTTTSSTSGTNSSESATTVSNQSETTATTDTNTSTFPHRSVVIVRQEPNRNAGLSQYMYEQLVNTFRYPYYVTTTRTEAGKISASDLENLAKSDADPADIYITPVAEKDVYTSSNHGGMRGIYRKNFSGDNNIHTEVQGSLYYYDVKNHQSGSVSKGFYGTQDQLTMLTHEAIYKDVMGRILQQLPYKRIPSGDNAYKPVSDTSYGSHTGTDSTSSHKGDVEEALSSLFKNPKDINLDNLLDALQARTSTSMNWKDLLRI